MLSSNGVWSFQYFSEVFPYEVAVRIYVILSDTHSIGDFSTFLEIFSAEVLKGSWKKYLVLTSGELEHSAKRETLLLPSMASRSIRAATSNSNWSKKEYIGKKNERRSNIDFVMFAFNWIKPLRDQYSRFHQLQKVRKPCSRKLPVQEQDFEYEFLTCF